MAFKPVMGVFSGQFSFASLDRLSGAFSTAKIKVLYRHFPSDPAHLRPWVVEAKSPWEQCDM